VFEPENRFVCDRDGRDGRQSEDHKASDPVGSQSGDRRAFAARGRLHVIRKLPARALTTSARRRALVRFFLVVFVVFVGIDIGIDVVVHGYGAGRGLVMFVFVAHASQCTVLRRAASLSPV
jgi:hypothetical protein